VVGQLVVGQLVVGQLVVGQLVVGQLVVRLQLVGQLVVGFELVRLELVRELLVVTLTISDASIDLRDPSRAGWRARPAVDYPATHPVDLVDADLTFLVELLSDPTIAWYEPLPVPPTDPTAIQLVRSFVHKASDPAGDTLGWALIEAGRRVGVCQLRRDDDGYLVGASLLASARGRGLGTAIFRALAIYAFRDLHANHVAGEVEDENIPSIRALHNASYAPVARYPKVLDNGRETVVSRFIACAGDSC
jgi:RimJ/RimL family protein N-acetyltransferase